MKISWIIDYTLPISNLAGKLILEGHNVGVIDCWRDGLPTLKSVIKQTSPDLVIFHADSIRQGKETALQIIQVLKAAGVKIIIYAFDVNSFQDADGILPYPLYSPEELLGEIKRVMQDQTE